LLLSEILNFFNFWKANLDFLIYGKLDSWANGK